MVGKYYIEEYPQDKFYFRLYDNVGKKKWQQIQQETGCYALMNLAYFGLSTFTNDSALMINGSWLFKYQYHEYGVCIDKSGHLALGTELQATCDYAVALPPHLIEGQKYYAASYMSSNGCTAIGIKSDGTPVWLLSSKDDGIDSTQMVDALKNAGCVHVLRYDGSWSSQGCLGNGVNVIPSQHRYARSYILAFKKDEQVKEDEPKMGFNTIKYLMTKNPCYTNNKKVSTKTKVMIHSTATPGGTAKGIADYWNSPSAGAGVERIIDPTGVYQTLPDDINTWHSGTGTSGVSANGTYMAIELCEPLDCRKLEIEWTELYKNGPYNSQRQYAIEWVQRELVARGYDPKGVDGSFGPGCDAAVRAFQKDKGLSVDGRVGINTLRKLQDREGSYLRYDAKKNEEFFTIVYNQAVEVTADFLKTRGGKSSDVICHSEGYKKGIASNHSDVMHWFPYHGKTMDNFRADVQKAMDGKFNIPAEPEKTPFELAVEELCSKGIINSPDYWKGNNYSVENVRALIGKFANYIK